MTLRIRRTAAAALLVLVATLTGSGTAHAETWEHVVSASTGKCLTVYPNGFVGQDFCESGRQTQLWTREFVDEGPRVYQLRNAAGGCLWAQYLLGARYASRGDCNANDEYKRFYLYPDRIALVREHGRQLMVTRAYGSEVVVFGLPSSADDLRPRWTFHTV